MDKMMIEFILWTENPEINIDSLSQIIDIFLLKRSQLEILNIMAKRVI